MRPGARSAALIAGEPTYSTGLPCKHGHVAPRITANSTCTVCAVSITQRAKARRKPKIKAANAAYYAENREKVSAINKRWRDAHPERIKVIRTAHYESNKPRYLAQSSKRRAARYNATPHWADIDAITAIYAEARRLTDTTGVPHDVDHIVPLQGRGVCGLHVPWNLQPIPARENRAKQNRL